MKLMSPLSSRKVLFVMVVGILIVTALVTLLVKRMVKSSMTLDFSTTAKLWPSCDELNENCSLIVIPNCGWSRLEPKVFETNILSSPLHTPWLVQVTDDIDAPDSESAFKCTGTIIDTRWILTVANCLPSAAELHSGNGLETVTSTIRVVPLVTALNGLTESEHYLVTAMWMSAELTSSDNETFGTPGLVLLHLDRDIEYNQYVQPLCVAKFDGPEIGRGALSYGYFDGIPRLVSTDPEVPEIIRVQSSINSTLAVDWATCSKISPGVGVVRTSRYQVRISILFGIFLGYPTEMNCSDRSKLEFYRMFPFASAFEAMDIVNGHDYRKNKTIYISKLNSNN